MVEAYLKSDEAEVKGSIYFLSRLPIYDSVKPYTLGYDPGNGIPATNIVSEQHQVKIQSMRSRDLSYETCGFQFCTMSSTMKYEDYKDESLIRGVHFPEVEACLMRILKASFVQIIDFDQRKRHPSFPVATGEAYEYMQPTSRVHIDVTPESARDVCRRALGHRADRVLAGRWQYINVWHPLRGPLYDWPLAVCDASSVDVDADTMPGDYVEAHQDAEDTEVHYNENQRWYYLPGQLASELLIFKNADSQAERGKPFGTPHAAFDLPKMPHFRPEAPRESIEMRVVIAW